MTALSTPAIEKSTYAITVAFTDTAGAPFTPNAGLTWTLSDRAGTVVNSRSNVAITSASTITIVLSGADLALLSAYAGRERVLTVQGTYNSTIGGTAYTDLPLKKEVSFTIDDLVVVT